VYNIIIYIAHSLPVGRVCPNVVSEYLTLPTFKSIILYSSFRPKTVQYFNNNMADVPRRTTYVFYFNYDNIWLYFDCYTYYVNGILFNILSKANLASSEARVFVLIFLIGVLNYWWWCVLQMKSPSHPEYLSSTRPVRDKLWYQFYEIRQIQTRPNSRPDLRRPITLKWW